MGGNNEFFENFERNKYLKKLLSMQRVNGVLLLQDVDLFCHRKLMNAFCPPVLINLNHRGQAK